MTYKINRDLPIPAYYQITMALRQRIVQGEWRAGDKLPPEIQLSEDYNVSRMTLRQAMAELTKDGLLKRKRGSGTFVSPGYFSMSSEVTENTKSQGLLDVQKNSLRHKVWKELRKVAKPDSRWHWNFEEFVPDFEGSEQCAATLREMQWYQESDLLFIAPDNSLAHVRKQAIEDGKKIIVATYAIERGFKYIQPKSVPADCSLFAATLDGLDIFGQTIGINELVAMGKINLLVTGVSLVSETGVRWGKGHGYFDLEWAIFRELGMVSEETPIIAVGHDCQVLANSLEPTVVDSVADAIITPSKLIYVDKIFPKPEGIHWKFITSDLLNRIPTLRSLKDEHGK